MSVILASCHSLLLRPAGLFIQHDKTLTSC